MNKSEVINEVIVLIKQLIYDYIAQSVYIVKWKNIVKGIVLHLVSKQIEPHTTGWQ